MALIDAPKPALRPDPGLMNRRIFRSRDLLSDATEVLIQHHDQVYRLRLTSNDKLILVK